MSRSLIITLDSLWGHHGSWVTGPSKQPMDLVLLLPLLYSWGLWSSETLGHMPKVTRSENTVRTGTWFWVSSSWHPSSHAHLESFKTLIPASCPYRLRVIWRWSCLIIYIACFICFWHTVMFSTVTNILFLWAWHFVEQEVPIFHPYNFILIIEIL